MQKEGKFVRIFPCLILFIHGYKPNQQLLPAQLMSEGSIQASPEFLLMKAKQPMIKIKSQEAFPLCHRLIPAHTQRFDAKTIELKEKLSHKPEPSELAEYFDVMLGKVEGLSAFIDISDLLAKEHDYENKEFWSGIVKSNASVKFYGQPKQKSHGIWELKNIDILKDTYDIEGIKKQRKLSKHYGVFYKSMKKFLDNFSKLDQKNQNAIKQVYEDYKKMEGEEAKYLKIIEKTKIESVKNQEPPPEPQPSINQQKPIEPIGKIQEILQKQEEQKESSSKFRELKKKKKQQVSQKKQKKASEPEINKNQKSIDFFLKKKKEEPKEAQKIQVDSSTQLTSFLSSLNQTDSIELLQQQFRSKKLKVKKISTVCFSTIVMPKSRLEYSNFPVCNIKVDFSKPFEAKREDVYEDSSQEYSDLIAESINDEMMEEDDEEEEYESNSAIVNDSVCQYQSGHELSSDESSQSLDEMIRPNVNKIVGKWSIDRESASNLKEKYSIFCLFQTNLFPLPVRENAEEASEITPQMKVQMFKQIHGSFVQKEVVIKKLSTILDNKMSMNKISSMIKDISERIAGQRILKPEIIKELIQEAPEITKDLQAELQALKMERFTAKNQQLEAKREERQNEKDQKLQKLLSQYEGVRTMSDMVEYLKSNDVKMIRSDLSSFIKSRVGEFWDQMREQIKQNKKNKRKKKQVEKVEEPKCQMPIDQILRNIDPEKRAKPKKKKLKRIIRNDDEEQYDQVEDKSRSKKTKRVRKIGGKVFIGENLPLRRNPRRQKKKEEQKISEEEKEDEGEEEMNEQIQEDQEGKKSDNIINDENPELVSTKEAKTANKSMTDEKGQQ